MPNLIPIQLKALFLLTVFTANFYSVCHCQNTALTRHTLSHANPRHPQHQHKMSCCADNSAPGKTCPDQSAPAKTGPDQSTPCNKKDGCCGTHAVKFSLLEKQAAAPISLHPLFAVALTHHFILPLDITLPSGPVEDRIDPQWQHKHSPPDLQSFYQRFLI